MMKLSVKAMAITAAIFWSLALLMTGIANLLYPDYATSFLEVTGSIYPGYHPGTGFSSVIVGAMYGFVDAGIAGAIFAWIYNFFVR